MDGAVPLFDAPPGEDVAGPLRAYQIEHEKKLAEQARHTAEEQEKIRDAAKADIEKFRRERAAKAVKARNDNKLAEEQTYQPDKEKEGGNPWERIVQLIDLKSGKTEGKDISSLRRILLEAKHLPTKTQ